MSIESNTKEAGKTYTFDADHLPGRLAQYWFQHPPEGLTLFAVFYTQACRWSKCMGCNLPSIMSKEHVPFQDIMRQIDHLFDEILTDEQKTGLKKVILSNNGSVLDERTFSTTALMYFIAKMNIHCPHVKVLTMETRPEYVDIEELEVLSRALKEGEHFTDLELAIGFEAYDEVIRNEHFKKGLSFELFESLAAMISKYHYKLKTYFMLKPVPQMSEIQAIEDIRHAIEYLDAIATRYDLKINMHLNPTYVASGTALAEAFAQGEYTPPLLESVRQAVLSAEGKRLSVYIGLNDEGLTVPGGSFIRPGDEPLIMRLERFNQDQNYQLLKQ